MLDLACLGVGAWGWEGPVGERLGFRILGPLSVTVGSRRISAGGARQRTILALLLLSPGRTVPVDTLVDAVWDGRPPATARTQVAIVIAALRKTFRTEGVTDDLIVTTHPGYLLSTEGHSLDAAEFDELVAQAEAAVRERRTDEAAQRYTQALGLWRGPALAGVGGRAVEEEAGRLEELRLNAFDDSTAVRLELGRHQEVIPELLLAVRGNPLRERTLHHLMLAQYRSGRRADAMEAFRFARRLFIDELGLEPGPAIQELRDAILRDDPSLAPIASGTARAPMAAESVWPGTALVPSELPPEVAGFTGRSRELEALDRLVTRTATATAWPKETGAGAETGREAGAEAEAAATQSPAVGLITGVAGIGKTGLALRWAHQVAERFPGGRLFADLRGYDEHHEPASARDVLSRLLRSLGVPSEQIPAELEERTMLYRTVLADRKVLLVLDNVRSFAQVKPLLPGSGACCVLITSREQLEELVTWPQQARVHLGLLSGEEAMQLLGRIVSEGRIAAARTDALRLVELCDRLPLALRIAAARLASKPHWSVRHLADRLSDERRRLDELSQGESQVRASFALSYRHLPPEAACLYRRLGLLQVPDFAVWVAGALLDVGVLEAERLIELLVDAQFLEAVGVDATGQLRFRFQNLLRLYAHERAREEEGAADQWAARDRVFRTCLTLAEQAHRREYGGDFSVLHSEVERRNLDPAVVSGLLAVPLEWFEAERPALLSVIEQSAGLGMDDLAWDLTMSMVPLFEIRNYVEDWRVCCEHALGAARAAGNVRGQAAMLHDLGAVALRLRRLEDADAYFASALELHRATDEEHGAALTLRNMAIIDRMRGDLDTAMFRLQQARSVFLRVGDRSSEAHALNNMAQIELDRGCPDTAVRLGLQAVAVSESIGEGGARGVAQGTHRLGRAYLAQGRFERAEEAFLRVVRIVKEKSDMVGLAYALLGLGEARLGAGASQKAEHTLADALEIVTRTNSPLVEGQIRLALADTYGRTRRIAAARQHLLAAQRIFEMVGTRPWQERAAQAERQLLALPVENACGENGP
ncbi:BTAD domain-containing putative transcriptional regulator [Streptomyces sp. NBC_00859]|uniref:AfsR/SARP family transcriptional regulator n=1 Tax=Streptomyces sp. NBC_00859 TaxID=2903682 RepID=UPI0038637F65|nr:tetratricopeptide repeat protein [Streptomyces sp. NBC_00859]